MVRVAGCSWRGQHGYGESTPGGSGIDSTKGPSVALPEGLESGRGTVENIALDRAVEISKIRAEAIAPVRINFWPGPAAFPIHPAILPERPVRPNPVLFEQAARAAGSGKDRSGATIMRVERQPVRGAPQSGFGRGIGIAQKEFEVRAVFQIGRGNNPRAGFHTIHEAQNIGETGLRVEVAAKQQGWRI